jgi:starch synthase (maltosyl-transferring)
LSEVALVQRKPDHPHRVVIEAVRPQVDGGRFPVKRTPGEAVHVSADLFADGHDVIRAVLRSRAVDAARGAGPWSETPMLPEVNDLWHASFVVGHVGVFEYAIDAWIDRFASWRRDLQKKFEARQDVSSELLEGALLVRAAANRLPVALAAPPAIAPSAAGPVPPRRGRTSKARAAAAAPAPAAGETPEDREALAQDRAWLLAAAETLERPGDQASRVSVALGPPLTAAMDRHADRAAASSSETLRVVVEPERARFGAWYEMFPRSCGPDPARSATWDEAAERLPAIAGMGFDVLYLPPIHPIGRTHRKGPNNTLTAGPDDPGSPWAIGGAEGGHMSVHPDLGTLDDFGRFVGRARDLGIDIALDLAYQCSPDHPYVTEHPEWFRHRPDGTIKYAENPPKRYQDIYPFDFEGEAFQALWDELKQIVLFWIDHGVRIFRVDNPHTKPFPFWEWMIAEVRRAHPGIIFLSEAFTRPKVMRRLAKVGFSQSYTYFTWRNTKPEIVEYFTELTQTDVREYMRPNLFANTPDILHEYLQRGGRPAFEVRLILAATLGATYGIYSGFEICENRAVPGTEEYLDSEKYQYRPWDWSRPGHITPLVTSINRVRRENPALHGDWSLRFHDADNAQLLAYSKRTPDLSNIVLTVVNLDPFNMQHGWVQVPVRNWKLDPSAYVVEDLLTGERYHWHGEWNYVRLDPGFRAAHVLRVGTPAAGTVSRPVDEDEAAAIAHEMQRLTT